MLKFRCGRCKPPDTIPTTPQTKPDPKGKAVASLIFSVISLTAPSAVFLLMPQFVQVESDHPIGGFGDAFVLLGLGFLSFLIVLPFSIFGLMFGILGLKSTKRPFAIVGIIFSILTLARLFLLFL